MYNKYSMKLMVILSLVVFCIGIFSDNIMAGSNYNLREIVRGSEKELELDIGGAEIYFDPDEDSIYVSEGLKAEKRRDKLIISSPDKNKFFSWLKNKEYYLIIGTARGYQLLDIAAGGIDITGKIVADEIDIKAGGINIKADIYSPRIVINGAGIDLDGYIKGEKIHINGAGINVKLEVEGLKDLGINGAGISADIRYLDGWSGIRQISLNGVGGDLNVYVPSKNNLNADGKLDINTNGIFDSNVHYY